MLLSFTKRGQPCNHYFRSLFYYHHQSGRARHPRKQNYRPPKFLLCTYSVSNRFIIFKHLWLIFSSKFAVERISHHGCYVHQGHSPLRHLGKFSMSDSENYHSADENCAPFLQFQLSLPFFGKKSFWSSLVCPVSRIPWTKNKIHVANNSWERQYYSVGDKLTIFLVADEPHFLEKGAAPKQRPRKHRGT